MKVLIAVDGSPRALTAAEFVRDLPGVSRLEATLLTVVNPPDVALSSSTEIWYPQYIEQQQEFAEESVRRAAKLFVGTDVDLNTQLSQGHVGYTIIDHAEQMGADLIAIGATGHSALSRMMLGSVSDYVATHAHCSVVVVRPRDNADVAHPHQISVAFDGSAAARTAIDEIAQFKWPQDRHLQVIMASPQLEVFREDILSSAIEEGTRLRSEAARTAAEGAAQLSSHGFDVTAETIETDHIGDGILQAADKFGSHLIVIGDAGRGPLTRLLLGSTSRYVLRHAQQSVWIVRHHESNA